VKGLVLTLVDDLTVLRLYIRLSSSAIKDANFNTAVQVRVGWLAGWLAGSLVCSTRWSDWVGALAGWAFVFPL
jgi:hypothetical protein